MWIFISILASIGQSWGFQEGLEYLYHYKTQLTSGIPEMNEQFAGVAMQADVMVQMPQPNSLILRFDKVQVGDFHKESKCDQMTSYKDINKGKDYLQKPFKIMFNTTDHLEVSLGEPIWVTNIKKSIIGVLPIQALWKELELHKDGDFARPNFGRQENLIHGTCMNWYSAIKFPAFEAVEEKKRLEKQILEDVQSSSSSTANYKGSRLQDELWRVTRDTDFDLCDKQTSVKFNAEMHDTDHVISRNSMGSFIIRHGTNGGIRIESAKVQGSFLTFIGEKHQDHLDTFTEQSLELISVKVLNKEIPLDTDLRQVHTWSYETASIDDNNNEQTNSGSSNSGNKYINIYELLTGDQVSNNTINDAMKFVMAELNSIVKNPRDKAHKMRVLTEIVSHLSYNDLKDIYNKIEKEIEVAGPQEIKHPINKITNFKIALILAGTEPSVNLMFEVMRNLDLTEDVRSMFFRTIKTTLKNPSLVNDILDLAMEITWKSYDPFTKTAALTGASILAHKYCFSPERKNYFQHPSRTEDNCDAQQVIDSFIPFLNEGLQNKSTPLWQRIVYLQSLTNLGSPHTLDILLSVIMTEDGEDNRYSSGEFGPKPGMSGLEYSVDDTRDQVALRTIAITSLSAHLLPHSAHGLAYSILLPIINNREEPHQVRSMAFLVLASWEPTVAWWQHMARLTWQEKSSSQFANFVSSTIEAIAKSNHKLSKIVSQVVYLTKPSEPVSITHSANIYLRDYINSQYIDRESSIIWLASSDGLIPTHIFTHLQLQNMFGFEWPTKINLNQNKLDFFLNIIDQYKNQFEYAHEERSSNPFSSEVTSEFFKIMREDLEASFRSHAMDADIMLDIDGYIKMAQELHFFGGGGILGFIQDLKTFLNSESGYTRGIDSTVIYPTDIGIPIIFKHTSDSFFKISHEWDDSLAESLPRPLQRGIMGWKFTIQASKDVSINAKSLVPWLNTFVVGAGIETKVDIGIPGTLHLIVNLNEKYVVPRLTLPDKMEEIVLASNKPYTIRGPDLLPPSRSNCGGEVKPIQRKNELFETEKEWLMASWTGICLRYIWRGDNEIPSLVSFLRGDYNVFIPTLNNWDFNLAFVKDMSPTNIITTILQLGYKNADIPEGPPVHLSRPYNPDYYSGEDPKEADIDTSAADKLLEKLNDTSTFVSDKILLPVTKGTVSTLSTTFVLEGLATCIYEIYIVKEEDSNITRHSTTYKIIYKSEEEKGQMKNTNQMCTILHVNHPNFLPLTTLKQLMDKNLNTHLQTLICEGLCEENEHPNVLFFKMEADIEVSPSLKQKLKDEHLRRCNANQELTLNNQLKSMEDVINRPLYDSATFLLNIDYEFLAVRKYYSRFISDDIREISPIPLPSPNDIVSTTSPNIVHVSGNRNYETNLWTVNVTTLDDQIQSKIKLPYLLEVPRSIPEIVSQQLINGGQSSTCVIDKNNVHTFDGVVYPFSSDSNCWHIMSVYPGDHSFMIEVRRKASNKQWEAKVIYQARGLFIQFTSSEIKVNNDTNPETKHKFYEIHREKHNGILVTLSNGVSFRVTDDQVMMQSSYGMRSTLMGLCGNFNGEKSYELKGPKSCFYDDINLYAKAWMTSSEDCDASVSSSNKKDVREYQENCTKETYVPTGVSHSNIPINCMEWQYQEKTEASYQCRAMTATPACRPGCAATYMVQESVTFECILVSGEENNSNKYYQKKFVLPIAGQCHLDESNGQYQPFFYEKPE